VDRINELIELGDLSILAEKTTSDVPHTYENPIEGVCVAYGRDRGETGVGYKVCKLNEYLTDAADKFGVDFCYLYDNGWKCNHDDSLHLSVFTLQDCG
jgi:hypothetical protein